MIMLKKEMGISGFLLLDKPSGLTSRWALERVQKKLKSQKAGHTGTLDFGVTGLLLIALGEARKTLPLLMNLDKEYEGEMHLHNDVSDDDIKKVFKEFEGKIEQLPPVRSRVARRPRIREIYSLQILGRNKRDVRFMAHCQHGTYIRKLVHDIGERLGCGAHMTKLRRTIHYNLSMTRKEQVQNTPQPRIPPPIWQNTLYKKTGPFQT